MLYRFFRKFADSGIFFYSVIWLMILLVVGTIAEQQSGLYYAQKNYFSVYFFLLFGFIPLPGTYTTLTIIFINLICKLMTDKWSVKKLGTLVTHISGLALLIGGFLTAHYSTEGYMDLTQTHSKNHFSDYNDLELVLNGGSKQVVFSKKDLVKNNTVVSKDIGFKASVTDYCEHCKLVTDANNQSQHLEPLPKPKDNEERKTIVGVNIENANPNLTSNKTSDTLQGTIIYLITNHPQPYKILLHGTAYDLSLRHTRTALPFEITLEQFKPLMHPGTEIAKSYESDVILHDASNQNKKWHAKISMNNPLRYKGYTFYQASYYVENNNYISVLAVVYNVGQSFPYIASILLCIGILLHLTQRLPNLFKVAKSNHET